jgi:hypothetical protein
LTNGEMGALFVTNLLLDATGHLVISNNMQVYFITSNNFSASQVTLIGNGGLHQLVLEQVATIPEPSVLLMWAAGFTTIWAARRRQKNKTGRRMS